MLKADGKPNDNAALLLRLAVFMMLVASFDYLGLALTRLGPHVATVWPAKGLVLAVFLFAYRRNMVRILAAAMVASVAARLFFGEAPFMALTAALINIGGAALTALFLRTLSRDTIDFHDWRMLARFFAVSCVAAVLIAIPGATASVLLQGDGWQTAFSRWALATGLSYVIFVPPLGLLATLLRESKAEAAPRTLLLTTLAVVLVDFAVFAQSIIPHGYPVALTLVIVAVAAGMEAAAIGLLVTAAIATGMAVLQLGPYPLVHGPGGDQLVALQIFLVLLNVGILPAAAVVSERNRLRLKLQGALEREHAALLDNKASEERYRMLAEQSKDIIVHTDASGIIRYMSPACRAFGYEPEELIGVSGYFLVHPDDAQSLAANTEQLLRGEKPDIEPPREHRFRKKNGEYVWLQGNPTVFMDADGRPAIINFFRDISRSKAMELALAEAIKNAEAATIAKSEFLANMSHEIRTPLTGVLGFSQLLSEQDDLPEKSRRYVGRVVQAAQSLLALVNDILDFSKLEAGQIEIRPVPAEPRQLAVDTLALFLPEAQRKGLALDLRVSEMLPDTVLLDDERVRQLLVNLVGNAVKFTRKGHVTLSLGYVDGVLSCTVADSGPGIPADKLNQLFQRFSQVDGTIARAHGGTGLGLAICKGLTDAMGGAISAQSEEGKGSIFVFAIPAPKSDGGAHVPQQTGQEDLKGLRVLVVDDNPASLDLLESTLKPEGVSVALAESGAQAVALAHATAFDIILMDLHMPGMSGAEAAAQIRAEGVNRATPIYAFTADAVRSLRENGTAGVFDGVMLKPLSLATLRRALRETAKAA